MPFENRYKKVKDASFESLIKSEYGNMKECFQLIRTNYWRTRLIMSKHHKHFFLLSCREQFDMCATIITIALQKENKTLDDSYSIDSGDIPPPMETQ